jgi:hypothetical protein
VITINTPYVHCKVSRYFLTDKKADINDLEECYIFAVTCINNRPPLFTCHTQKGAIFSRLPLHAFRSLSYKPNYELHYDLSDLCPWTVVGNSASVIQYEYLKNYEVKALKLNEMGKYQFTIDYFNGGLSEDPEQHKTHNIIELDNGYFAAVPNNYMLAKDEHFTFDNSPIDYSRQTEFWRVD